MRTRELVVDARVPFADLRSALLETEHKWRVRLEALFARAEFVLGSELAGFEADFAAAMRVSFAIGVSSGTSALELSLRASKTGSGADEVITTPFTAPFTAVAIAAAGYKPRFADVDAKTLLLDANDVGNRLSKSTSAVIPVHLYGQPYDVSGLSAVLKGRGIGLIQDACQAHSVHAEGTPLADLSQFVAYSFYPTKNLGCLGDGGAIITNDSAAARRLRLMRDGGRGRHHISLIAGTNARLDEIQACFLRAFLPSLDGWNKRRRELARLYEQGLRDCTAVRIVPQRRGSVYHLFVIRVEDRERLRSCLSGAGIGTAIHYPVPLNRHPAFRNPYAKRGDFPNAEKAGREVLSLPIRPQLSDDAVLYVAEKIREFYSSGPR
ncbi:MAG: DegT/DnrJ/EryC1/StrS family aminotransferase [Bryobacteraceae bacterium]